MSDEHTIPDERGVETGRSTGSAPFHVHDLRAYLAGPWLFERTVFDAKTDAKHTARGQAAFIDEPVNGEPGLRYRELGELELNGERLETQREYIYGFPAHGVAEVRFDDGRFFHVLDLSKGIVRVEHKCGDDTYQGLFRVLTEQAFLSVWRVDGPRKTQVITTHYLRA